MILAQIQRLGAASALLAFLAIVAPGCTTANQQTFATPEQAAEALVSAVRAGDRGQLKRILGPDAEDTLTSGDAVADVAAVRRFLEAYDAQHRLEPASDDNVEIIVGSNEWPMPIPIVRDPAKGEWRFDTAAGKEEIINRRIGENELNAIKVCEAIGDAEREYAQRDPANTGFPVYTQKFFSSPGKKDGLYWKVDGDESPSPLGVLVAEATTEGYRPNQSAEPQPYHGYYYRILSSQGTAAPGGARDYSVNGKLIGGFAVVAWPAEYGSSGIMTFLMNHDGIVYQQDLGEDTDDIARKITTYDPAPGWRPAGESEPTSNATNQ